MPVARVEIKSSSCAAKKDSRGYEVCALLDQIKSFRVRLSGWKDTQTLVN